MELILPQRPDSGSHAAGIAVVVGVHVVIGYALLSGLAQKVVEAVRDPLEARLIDEIKKPPPPPPEPPKAQPKPIAKVATPPPPAYVPPPEVAVAPAPVPAPTITTTQVAPPPPPVEVKPEPPPAPPPPPPAAPPKPAPVTMAVACPTQVAPVLPRRAQQEGVAGQVRAQLTIRGGKVVDVQILSSKPKGLFDAAVRTAMLQYGCTTTGADEIVAQQTFEFRAPD